MDFESGLNGWGLSLARIQPGENRSRGYIFEPDNIKHRVSMSNCAIHMFLVSWGFYVILRITLIHSGLRLKSSQRQILFEKFLDERLILF